MKAYILYTYFNVNYIYDTIVKCFQITFVPLLMLLGPSLLILFNNKNGGKPVGSNCSYIIRPKCYALLWALSLVNPVTDPCTHCPIRTTQEVNLCLIDNEDTAKTRQVCKKIKMLLFFKSRRTYFILLTRRFIPEGLGQHPAS